MIDLLKNEKLIVGLKILAICSISSGIYGFLLCQIIFFLSPELLELLQIVLSGNPEVPISWLEVSIILSSKVFSKGLWLGLILGAFGFWFNTQQPYFKIKLWSVAIFFGTMAALGLVTYVVSQFVMPQFSEQLQDLSIPDFDVMNTMSVGARFHFLTAIILVFFQFISTLPSLFISCIYQYRKLTKDRVDL